MKSCVTAAAASFVGMRRPAAFVRCKRPRQFGQFGSFALRHAARWGIASVFALIVITTIAGTAWAQSGVQTENESIRLKRSSERTAFSDAEIADGFFKIAFGAEFNVARDASRVRKFDGPVRVFLDDRAHASRRADIAAVIGDIRTYVDYLDIALSDDRKAANVVVTLVRDRGELLRTMRSFYGRKRADEIERRLRPRCLSGFSEDAEHRIRRAEILLTADGGDFNFIDCAYEELLQALGPINDDRSVPWTMFNDDVQMGFFDVYDQYILNILYDPHVRPGMTRRELKILLPNILPEIRKRISAANLARRLGASNDGVPVPNTPLPGQSLAAQGNPRNRITYNDCRDGITTASDINFPALP